VNTAGILALQILLQLSLGDVRAELLVDVVGKERCERCEATAEGEDDLEEGVQSVKRVINTILSLQTTTVEANVPVCGVVDELKQTGNDGVQAVSYVMSVSIINTVAGFDIPFISWFTNSKRL
jgi:hypothetical protein